MRHIGSARVAVPAVLLIGAVVKYRSRVVAPPVEAEAQQFGEFNFRDGILTPHREYLYGYSKGQHFIVGKKIPGHDYTAWEEEYERFGRTESVTFANSNTQSTWSWSVKEGNPITNLTFLQLLLWLILGVACALLLCYLGYKVLGRFSRKKRDKRGVLTNPGGEVDTEYSITALKRIWRHTLLPIHREQKCEILSLQKLAVHYYDRSISLKKSLNAEREEKGRAQSELKQVQEDHALELAEEREEKGRAQSELKEFQEDHALVLAEEREEKGRAQRELKQLQEAHTLELTERQREMEDLRQRLNDLTLRSENLDQFNKALMAHNVAANQMMKDLDKQIIPIRESDHVNESLVEQDEAFPATGKQNVEREVGEQEEILEAEHSAAEAVLPGAESIESQKEQDEKSPAAEEATPGIRNVQETTEQDDASPAPGYQRKRHDGNLWGPRPNKRSDGTFRNPNHPDFVPRAFPHPQPAVPRAQPRTSQAHLPVPQAQLPVPRVQLPVPQAQLPVPQARQPPPPPPPQAQLPIQQAQLPPVPGDRPIHGLGRGNGYQGGNGFGRGGGMNRGPRGARGNGGGRFGWRGGRSGRGGRGN